jgi:hypothetical protein
MGRFMVVKGSSKAPESSVVIYLYTALFPGLLGNLGCKLKGIVKDKFKNLYVSSAVKVF